MASDDQHKNINRKLIEVLKDLLGTGDWEASLFLRTAHKKLQDLLGEAVSLSTQLDEKSLPTPEEEYQSKLNQGYIKVYVSIYQSDPYNLVKWENTLKSIREYSITRPIYRNEEHIREVIRSKRGSMNEGYVAIYMKQSDILPPPAAKVTEDKWGHELITLRSACLLASNIVEFVYGEKRYGFKEGKLLLKSAH
jgi:Dot/Icm secretion system protein IcmQ